MIELPLQFVEPIFSIIPALIMAAGALAGGAIAAKSGRDAQKSAQAQDARKIQTLVADAKIAGIHPLAALGSSISLTPTQQISGQSATGSAVADASRAIAGGFSRQAATKANAPMQQAQIELIQGQTALARSQSLNLDTRSADMIGSQMEAHDSAVAKRQIAAGGGRGFTTLDGRHIPLGRGEEPVYTTVVDDDGKRYRVYREEMAESMEAGVPAAAAGMKVFTDRRRGKSITRKSEWYLGSDGRVRRRR